jgi:hypothetical protein
MRDSIRFSQWIKSFMLLTRKSNHFEICQRILVFVFVFSVLKLKLRALKLLCRHSTTWATSPPFFALVIFQAGSHLFFFFLPRQACTVIFLPSASHVARTIGTGHHAQLIDWDGGVTNFLPGMALNCNPPDLCLLSSWGYRHKPLCLAGNSVLNKACPQKKLAN